MIKPVAAISAGTALGQLAMIVVLPILTRYYSEEDFGLLAIVTSVVGLATYLATARLELAMLMPKADLDAYALGEFAIKWALLVGLLVASTVHLANTLIGFSPGLANSHAAASVILALGIFSSAFFLLGIAKGTRAESYGQIAVAKGLFGLVVAASQLAGAILLHPSGIVLSGAVVIGYFAGGFYLHQRFRVRAVAELKLIQQRGLVPLQLLIEYRRFPLVSMPSSLINAIAMFVPPLAVAHVYGIAQAGIYILAVKVLFAPTSLLGKAVGQYFQGRMTASIRNRDHKQMRVVFDRVSMMLASLAIPLLISVALFGPFGFEVIFGMPWRDAGIISQTLIFAAAAQLISLPVSNALVMLHRERTQLVWDALRTVFVLTAIFIAARLGLTLIEFVRFYTAVLFVFYVVHWLLCRRSITNEALRQ